MTDRAIDARIRSHVSVLLLLGLAIMLLAATLAFASKPSQSVIGEGARYLSSVEINGVEIPYTIDMIAGRLGSSPDPFPD